MPLGVAADTAAAAAAVTFLQEKHNQLRKLKY